MEMLSVEYEIKLNCSLFHKDIHINSKTRETNYFEVVS